MRYKICRKCGKKKDLSEFRKSKNGKLGTRSDCRLCEKLYKKVYRKSHPEDSEKVRARNQRYYKNNKEHINNLCKEYYDNNRIDILKKRKNHYLQNKETIRYKQKVYYNTSSGFVKHSEKRVKRNMLKNKTTPTWVNLEDIKQIYRACPEGYHVDHIIPLQGEKVSGLNVPENLQYLTESENCFKTNKFDFTTSNQSWRKEYWDVKRLHTPKELHKEFKTIMKETRGYSALSNLNKITTHFNQHFYEVERKLWQDLDIRNKLIENRVKYLSKDEKDITDKEFLRGFKISGIHYGFSHHSSFWIKKFIETYNISSIYDPCGGWGHRLLGAYNINYIYNDLDFRSCKAAANIVKFFNLQNKIIYNQDAETFTPKEDYECVFTCPPYFTTEIYTNKRTSTDKYPEYINWLNQFWRGLIRSSLKPSVKYFCFIVNSKYLEDMKRVCESEGLELIEIKKVGQGKKSHFKKDKTEKYEQLLIFKV